MVIRRRILQAIIISVITVALISSWYINRFLAPTMLKDFFLGHIGQVVNRPVALNAVHFGLTSGFTLEGLSIYEANGKDIFLKIDRISTSPFFIPVIKKKLIIIPSARISSPVMNIVKNEGNSWNFSNPPLLKSRFEKKGPAAEGYSVLVQRVTVEKGQIDFTDNTRSPVYAKQLIGLEGSLFISRSGVAHFNTVSRLNTPKKTEVYLSGSYDLKENGLSATINLKNLSLIEPYNYFYKMGLFVDLKKGTADMLIDLKTMKDNKIALKLDSSVRNLDLSLGAAGLKGDLGITGTSELNLARPMQSTYKVQVTMKGAGLDGVYLLKEVSNLTGIVVISNDGIFCNYMGGQSQNCPVTFKGQIANFRDPVLNASVEVAMDLANYKNFLPDKTAARLKELAPSGPARVSVRFYHMFKDPQQFSVSGNIRLKGDTLSLPSLNKFEKISGDIVFRKNTFYLSRILFDYGGRGCALTAKIDGLETPDVKIKLRSDIGSLDSRFSIASDNIHILRAAVQYLNSSLKIAGDIRDYKNPGLSLEGTASVDLADLGRLMPQISEGLTRSDVKGLCDLEFSVNGPCRDPRDLQLSLRGESDRIIARNLKFDKAKLEVKMRDGFLTIPEFSARPYGGTLLVTMEMDLKQQNPPYTARANIEGLDLSRLAVDADIKNKRMTGKGMARLNLRGYGKNLDTIKGNGMIFIKGGYLWELPVLTGIADLLFLSNTSGIIFDEASCDFTITNRTVSTSNLTLHSKNISLLAEGGLGFDGALDLLVTTTISEDYVKNSSAFGKLTGILLSEARQMIGNIHVGGNIKKPEYKFMPLPLDSVLKNKLNGLLGKIF